MGLPSHKAHPAPSDSTGVYVRHRPETTLLYQIVQEYWPEFQAELASHGKTLPAYVTKEFDEYLKCGILEHGFFRIQCEACHDEKILGFSCKKRGFRLRAPTFGAAVAGHAEWWTAPLCWWMRSCHINPCVNGCSLYRSLCAFCLPANLPSLVRMSRCREAQGCARAAMGKVLGIVYRAIATHLTRKAGYTKATARTGAVTLIQCFGGALNAHVHLTCMDALMSRAHGCAGATHMLFLDGVYADNKHGTSGFHRLKAPTNYELIQLTHTIAHRVGHYLERQGLLVRDSDQSYLTADAVDAYNETPMNHLLGSSITYRIAVGPQQGRKVFA